MSDDTITLSDEPATGVKLGGLVGRTTADQCDYNGHMNMAEYVKIVDQVADIALGHLGLGVEYTQAHRKSLFVSKIAMKYRTELSIQDEYHAEASLLAFDAQRLIIRTAIKKSTNYINAAIALAEWVHVDLGTRKPLDLTAPTLCASPEIGGLRVERLPRFAV